MLTPAYCILVSLVIIRTAGADPLDPVELTAKAMEATVSPFLAL